MGQLFSKSLLLQVVAHTCRQEKNQEFKVTLYHKAREKPASFTLDPASKEEEEKKPNQTNKNHKTQPKPKQQQQQNPQV